MPDFTPGKWEYWKHENYPYWYVGKVGSQRFLATVDKKANARLIAAAPEMYQWIEDARSFLSEWKLRCGDEDEMRAYWPEFCRTFHELLTTSDLLLARIDGLEDYHDEPSPQQR